MIDTANLAIENSRLLVSTNSGNMEIANEHSLLGTRGILAITRII